MKNQLIYVVEEKYKKIKLFDYMTKELDLSVRFTKAASKDKRIEVNGKPVTLDYLLSFGDRLIIYMKDDETQNIQPEEIPLNLVYEDEDVLVVNKPPFMLVHPSENYPSGSLASAVLFHFNQNQDGSIVRLVSRLDRDTSGLVLIAKNAFAHMQLARANEENNMDKVYVAVVHGSLNPSEGTIHLPIGKSETILHRREVRPDGQNSITHYRTIENYPHASLVELQLETGRTHQIRVHLSHMGAPIIGDLLYGSQETDIIQRQALHAKALSFPHPRTGEKLFFTTDYPEDIGNLIIKLNK